MKFYKIVHPHGHNGLVYHEGINVDPLPFKPWGSCEDGGIYFSREDILYFLDYGTELYEVEPIGEVYEDPQASPKKWKAHSIKLTYVGKALDSVQFLIEQGADIHADNDYALRWAVENGDLDLVKYLVEQGADIHADNDYALRWAAECGYFGIAKYLVEQGADIHAGNDYSLRWAVEHDHLEVVKYLVEHGADIHVDDDLPLQWAMKKDYQRMVKYLKSKM